ncbi:DUF421 domain-containing protein [Desulforamulus aquiferis]|uniref:DUF421 domain-containing protein n=1 Tax=Desulforamulus aquiferis TaxID=1397668 RepID=A0AAW7ZEG4_9FIRM|nr:DUF421 domain-containing protein [Desulforamulus aquiferis]MDO7787659.1 DUF421 domain-containing protein [Desulforamulus aquiferis]RYD05972.1 hypothetical protein N752_06925 [Desulforamulus aquiferis]
MEELFKVLWKSIVVFIMLVVFSRIIGKKLLSQLTFFDFTIGILIGTITGTFVTTEVKGLMVLLSPVILTLLVVMVAFLTVKSMPVRKLLEGEPVVVIQNGKIMEKGMLRLRYHLDDLEMQLREKGIFNITEVEFAVMEPHGYLSVLKKSQHLPVTMKDIGKPTQYKGMATEIIKDGDVFEQNLRQNNLTFAWLYEELRKRNIEKLSDVTYASLESDGTLYTDVKDDKLEYVQKVEDGPITKLKH